MSRYTFIAFVFGAVLVHLQRYEMVCHHSSFSMTIKWWVRIYIFFSLFCSFVFIIAISSISSYFGEKKNLPGLLTAVNIHEKWKECRAAEVLVVSHVNAWVDINFMAKEWTEQVTSALDTRAKEIEFGYFVQQQCLALKTKFVHAEAANGEKNWTASINLSNVSDVWPLVKCLFGVFVALGLWCDVRWSRKIELNHHHHQTSSKLKPNKYNTT